MDETELALYCWCTNCMHSLCCINIHKFYCKSVKEREKKNEETTWSSWKSSQSVIEGQCISLPSIVQDWKKISCIHSLVLFTSLWVSDRINFPLRLKGSLLNLMYNTTDHSHVCWWTITIYRQTCPQWFIYVYILIYKCQLVEESNAQSVETV